MGDVDLELLADAYRYRTMSPAVAAHAATSSEGCHGVALDVGGGVGGHAVVMRSLGLTPVVIDASPTMCASASAAGVASVLGLSADLPVRDGVAGLVYFHLSIHYGDWRRALDEAVRALAVDGRIDIWTFDPAAMGRAELARWFPSVAVIDARRFPAIGDLAGRLEESGFDVAITEHPETVVTTAGAWLTAVRNRFVSTLQLIDDHEFERGIAAFLAGHSDPGDTHRYTIDHVRISANR
jgi:SAM-dependent methyltransferase